MTEATAEMVKYLVTISVPATVGLLTLCITNRNNMIQAKLARNHEEQLAAAEAREARTERRYEERRTAFIRLIDQATEMRDRSLLAEYEGKPSPGDYLDGPELESYFKPLRNALNEVLLLGTSETRDTAERVRSATEQYVWTWSNDAYTTLDRALIDFRAAARSDLGIDGGFPEVAARKPPRSERRGEPVQKT